MLLLGFDWHSQPLHNTSKWQEQWCQARIKKVAILQEHYSATVLQATPTWKQLFWEAISSAITCVNALICCHEPDVEFLKVKEQVDKPIMFLPFAIDSQYFKSDNNFYQRINGAFFRGNASKFFASSSYTHRRELLEKLYQFEEVIIVPLESGTLSNPLQAVQLYANELNKYRLLLNLPSVSPTLTSRPYEIMGCGGVLLQNKINGKVSNSLFEDWKHLVYYDPEDCDDVISKIKYLIKNPGIAAKIAGQGYSLCQKEHTIQCRIKTIIDWLDCEFDPNFYFDDYKKNNLNLILERNPDQAIRLNPENALNLKKASSQNKLKVSAIISTYNSEKFIRGCLQDLVEQTLYRKNELEIIVIDSSSEQNEQKIVQGFQSDYANIIYERTLEREPLYTAWNRAIKMATGIYITNANTDDRHRFDALELMADYLDIHSDISLVYADQLITMAANDTFGGTQADRKWNWPPFSYEQMKQGCCVGSQPMWRKSLHDKYGYFREEFKCAGDYEFWLRIGSQGEQMALIPEILGLY